MTDAGTDQIAAPDRTCGEGPHDRLVLRNVTVIDGTGAAPYGPADILIEGNRITGIWETSSSASLTERPAAEGAVEMDLSGHYVLPGIVDSHGHIGNTQQAPNSEYVYKLWLGHGVTSVREVGAFNGLDWTVREAQRSDRGEIAAPRIHVYPAFRPGPAGSAPILTAQDAVVWVNDVAERGAKGVKFFAASPVTFSAALEELARLGLGSACHHDQRRASQVNALTSARWGLGSIEHWYGMPEAMFRDRTVQHVPAGYNHNYEPDRFAQGAHLWLQTAERGSKAWEQTLEEFLQLGTTLSPTFNIYIGSRDAARVRSSEWHEDFTAPVLWDFFQPSEENHGSYMGDWGTEQEVAWRHAYAKWMSFVNDYKNLGGRVTAGSDSGFIYKTFGFGIIEELELLREAGFQPLEVIRAATLHGAELMGIAEETGSVEPGKLADLMIVDEDPLANLKVLYGHGHLRLTDDGLHRVGGVKYTLRDGIVYDAHALREDVKHLVRSLKEAKEEGIPLHSHPE
ncbi:amidohydrolase family protein [Nesterenkonia rhizosphaerae]|uniref:Amidohydrolase family protein n=1 Tax=Nesterenkonia rhizosphaerae TaxID=1348272 RepID=A0ABP9FW19_9MICC